MEERCFVTGWKTTSLERERQRQRHTDRQTDRQKETDRHRKREKDRRRHREREKYRRKLTDTGRDYIRRDRLRGKEIKKKGKRSDCLSEVVNPYRINTGSDVSLSRWFCSRVFVASHRKLKGFRIYLYSVQLYYLTRWVFCCCFCCCCCCWWWCGSGSGGFSHINSPEAEQIARNKLDCSNLSNSVQFSSRWYLCARNSPYALCPVSQRFTPEVAFETAPVLLLLMIAFIERYSPLSSRFTALACDSTWVNSFL